MTFVRNYNLEAEEQVLGSVFLEPGLIKEMDMPLDAFSPGKNCNLYWTFKDMDKKGKPIDIFTVADRIGSSNIHKVGGVSGIAEIANSVVNTNHFEYYCQLIWEKYKENERAVIGKELEHGLTEEMALDKLRQLNELGRKRDEGDIQDDLQETFMDLEAADGTIKGSRTGFTDLDNITGGIESGLIIVGARPSMGKTAFAINVGVNAAESPENPDGDLVDIFSYEMKRKALLKRVLGSVGNIDLSLMKTAQRDFAPTDWGKVSQAMGIVSKKKLKILEASGMGTADIRSHVRKRRMDNPDKRIMIIIDYLQLIQGDPKLTGNRQQQVSDISRELKLIAMEFDVVVIALSQLSRKLEDRQDKRPMMSDLRESGSLEQDADMIAFLYRESYYDQETADQNMIEVIVAKQRDGATGTVKLAFIKEYGKFVSIDWSHMREKEETTV